MSAALPNDRFGRLPTIKGGGEASGAADKDADKDIGCGATGWPSAHERDGLVACCRWRAPCSNSRRCSTPATRFGTPPAREHPSLCSIESGHPFVPTCLLAERRAQRQSRMPPRMRRHRRSRRKASLTERARCYPLPWRHYTTGCRAGLPPRSFSLDHWWEVLFLQRGVSNESFVALQQPENEFVRRRAAADITRSMFMPESLSAMFPALCG